MVSIDGEEMGEELFRNSSGDTDAGSSADKSSP